MMKVGIRPAIVYKKIWFQIHQTKGVHKTDTGEITSFKNFINHSQSIEYLMTRHQRS